ncbi:hypothetical protein BsWGS_17274 [Bradybaena similaris]
MAPPRSTMARPFEFEMTSRAEAYLRSPEIDCEKSSTHERFIPIREFTKEHLLPGLQDNDIIVNCIKALGNLTVRIRCPLTSKDRPDTMPNSNRPYPFIEYRGEDRHPRYATGWVLFVDREPRAPIGGCPCHLCQNSPTPKSKFARIEIRTAAHHVYDRKEAEKTTCDLFFDEGSFPGDDSKQLVSCSIAQAQHDYESDSSDLTFFTHDMELAERLEGMVREYQTLHKDVKRNYPDIENSHPDNVHKLTVIVSHPHGCSKHVSVGVYEEVDPMENRGSLTRYFYNTASCPGSSGAPVFVLSRGWLWLFVEHAHCGGWNDELNYSGFALK